MIHHTMVRMMGTSVWHMIQFFTNNGNFVMIVFLIVVINDIILVDQRR